MNEREVKGWQITAKFRPPAPRNEASDRASGVAALWAVAIALAVIAALLALNVMINT
jgi:hypothetical protein